MIQQIKFCKINRITHGSNDHNKLKRQHQSKKKKKTASFSLFYYELEIQS